MDELTTPRHLANRPTPRAARFASQSTDKAISESRLGYASGAGVRLDAPLRFAKLRAVIRHSLCPVSKLIRKVQNITCHELTHAFTSHLHLPTWLNEDLAMVMVDKFFEKCTVQYDTLEVLERSSDKHSSGGRQKLRVGDEDARPHTIMLGYQF